MLSGELPRLVVGKSEESRSILRKKKEEKKTEKEITVNPVLDNPRGVYEVRIGSA